jgi:uncharacterized protein YbjQ (UPF0145 family)
MIIVTTEEIPGYEIVETLSLVRGSSTRSRSFISDFTASIKNLVGGEISEYTKLLAHTREQAIERMTAMAAKKGGNAIIGVRFATSSTSVGTIEVLSYGTAVKIKSLNNLS